VIFDAILKQDSEFWNGKLKEQNYNQGRAFETVERLPKFEIKIDLVTPN
jgi:hypothetical protein